MGQFTSSPTLHLLPTTPLYQMNKHTRKLLDDARNRKSDDVLNDLEYDDININASD